MEVVLYRNKEWLFSQEAFFIYSSCMYQPTYDEYRKVMEQLEVLFAQTDDDAVGFYRRCGFTVITEIKNTRMVQ